ncbi:MAG: TolC family protein [Deltaproteobacteria bacterium]|nr:TolC family protein [Deltaproteobacteria bacterium]
MKAFAVMMLALLLGLGPVRAGDGKLPEKLTLAEAMSLAEQRNLSLQAATEDLAKAEASYKKAWSSLLPVASVGLGYTIWDHAATTQMADPSSPDGFRDITIKNQQDLSGDISVSAPLIQPQAWWGVRLGDLGRGQAELSLKNSRQAILLAVAQTFYLALASKRLMDIQSEQIDRAKRHLTVADLRHRSGTGKRLDVIRASTELLDAEDQAQAASTAYDKARDALGSLLGSRDGKTLPIPVEALPLKKPSWDKAEWESKALSQREDLLLGRLAVRLADEQLTQVWLGFLPSLNANWQLSYQFTEPSSFGSVDRSRWFIGLSLNLPLYDHTRYADLDQSRATLRQARIRLDDAEREALLQLRQAQRSHAQTVAQRKVAEEKVALTREALELVESAYINGTGSSLEVTDARRNWRTSEIGLASKVLENQLKLLEWLRLAGEDLRRLTKQSS